MKSKGEKRVLSGMRPTGPLHLGHLFGVLGRWVELQKDYRCFYMVADWHAFLSEYEQPSPLKDYTRQCVADWLSLGIDPSRSVIFLQSAIKEHLLLHFIFSAITPLPWLERCPTFKEQIKEIKNKDLLTYGFLGYPVLQAADILVYRAHAVPVGEDQLPHLELTREIARRFNHFYGRVLPLPQAILTKAPRVLGLDNRKMSKSYLNFIALADSPETIRKKTARMITDPARVYRRDPGHPEVCNVFSYYKLLGEDSIGEIERGCRSAARGCSECKRALGELLVEFLAPVREKRGYWLKDGRVEEVLDSGAVAARREASSTMEAVYKSLGW